jgi:hypothetical protein
VDISSANIPAVSFVVTADRPARCHQRNEMKPSILLGSIGFPVVAVKSQLEKSHHPFPSPIASHSQLEEITWGMPFNGIA